jgi:hypothetical protein
LRIAAEMALPSPTCRWCNHNQASVRFMEVVERFLRRMRLRVLLINGISTSEYSAARAVYEAASDSAAAPSTPIAFASWSVPSATLRQWQIIRCEPKGYTLGWSGALSAGASAGREASTRLPAMARLDRRPMACGSWGAARCSAGGGACPAIGRGWVAGGGCRYCRSSTCRPGRSSPSRPWRNLWGEALK